MSRYKRDPIGLLVDETERRYCTGRLGVYTRCSASFDVGHRASRLDDDVKQHSLCGFTTNTAVQLGMRWQLVQWFPMAGLLCPDYTADPTQLAS